MNFSFVQQMLHIFILMFHFAFYQHRKHMKCSILNHFINCTLQSKAVLSALLSAADVDAFLISVDTRNG